MIDRLEVVKAMKSAYIANSPLAVFCSHPGMEAALDSALDFIIEDLRQEEYQRTAGYMTRNYRKKR